MSNNTRFSQMDTFDPKQHYTTGDANVARSWIAASALSEEQKTALLTFVQRFETLTFVKEDDILLDHYEEVDGVTIPAWFRKVRKTVAGIEQAKRVRLGSFAHELSPRSDSLDKLWYELWPGYINEEQQELIRDKAHVYPIGGLWDTDRSYLAVDLKDPSNTQILEFALEDFMDNDYDGIPLRDSSFVVFDSYAQLLANIAAIQLPDGTEIKAGISTLR